jgi:hypothetical protein
MDSPKLKKSKNNRWLPYLLSHVFWNENCLTGYDEVPSRILKYCASEISKSFSYIHNCSLKSGIYTERLKYAIVKPVYKKGDKNCMINYRPISLPTTISKILEPVVFNR